MSWGALRSPKGVTAEELDGNADDIEAAGRHYSDIGTRMAATAVELEKLGNSEKYKAKSIDAVRESARELHGDLAKAATRYEKTGPVLVTYAGALRTARTRTVDPLVPEIIAAHAAHQDALDAQRAAQGAADDANTTHFWEEEATDAQKATAARELSSASALEGSTGGTLDELWTSFDGGYADWETAYEAAANGIADAIEASGINDSWWEDLLDGLATVATVVATIAIIAALVIGGPIFLAIAAVAGIVALAAHCIMMAAGSKRVSWTDIAFDAIGVIPFLGAFGKGLLASRGIAASFRGAVGLNGASRGFLSIGRNAITRDLRTVTGAGRFAGNRAARDLAAPGLADAFLHSNTGRWAGNAWNALRGGGSVLDGQAYTVSQRLAAAWPGAGSLPAGGRAATWAAQYSTMPSLAGQGLNLWNTGYGGYQSAQGAGVPLPDMPDFIGGAIDLIRGR